VPDDVWLLYRAIELRAARPELLKSLPAREGRNSDIVVRWCVAGSWPAAVVVVVADLGVSLSQPRCRKLAASSTFKAFRLEESSSYQQHIQFAQLRYA
jgi:hypothetical protein